MSRPLRIEYPGAFYHVLNRGLARNRIFLNDSDRLGFLDLVGDICRLWGLGVYTYCLMDNHYHLLLQTPRGGLSRAMRHLDGIYTQRFNRMHGRDGPLFRGRYRAILIDAESYFLAVARYIHWNPVEAGVVSEPSGYRWSSHGIYLGNRRGPGWLNIRELLSRFGKGSVGLSGYRQFMDAGVDEEVRGFYKGNYLRPVLGGKEFVQRVKERLGKKARVQGEVPESRRVFGLTIGEVVEATAKVYGKEVEELLRGGRGRSNEARGMAMYLCRVLGGHRLGDIGRVLGSDNYSSVSSVWLGMKRRIEREGSLAARARKIEELLMKS